MLLLFFINKSTFEKTLKKIFASCEGGNQVSILLTFYMQLLCHYSCAKNLQSQTVSRENVHKALFFKKACLYC